jgi:hypothetical protein
MNTMKDYLEREAKHKEIVKELYEKYKSRQNDVHEFTWDGPSDWQQYSAQQPRILFLAKESRNEFQPHTARQGVLGAKFMMNIARWKYVIGKYFGGQRGMLDFPTNELIMDYNDDVAIVEVKKLNEEKITSSKAELKRYAREDKEFLRQQIDLIDPHLVVCCYTIDEYHIIYDETYEPYDELYRLIQPYQNGKNTYVAWNLSNRLVIDFYHPSTRGGGENNATDYRYFSALCQLMDAAEVQKFIQQIKAGY